MTRRGSRWLSIYNTLFTSISVNDIQNIVHNWSVVIQTLNGCVWNYVQIKEWINRKSKLLRMYLFQWIYDYVSVSYEKFLGFSELNHSLIIVSSFYTHTHREREKLTIPNRTNPVDPTPIRLRFFLICVCASCINCSSVVTKRPDSSSRIALLLIILVIVIIIVIMLLSRMDYFTSEKQQLIDR